MDEVRDRSGVEAVARGRNVRQETGAGGVVGIEELARAADRILLAGFELLVILRRQKCGQVVIEPPGDSAARPST